MTRTRCRASTSKTQAQEDKEKSFKLFVVVVIVYLINDCIINKVEYTKYMFCDQTTTKNEANTFRLKNEGDVINVRDFQFFGY